MLTSKYVRLAFLVAIVLAGAVIRARFFPHLPPGFNQDEASSAYEAFSLAATGLDRWGNQLPAYFPSWGSGQNVLLAYLTVPVVKVMGLNVFSARLVMLVLGVLTLPLLAYCLRPLGHYTVLLATLLLAFAPWHFMLSRWGLESNLAPFFMLLGCTAVSRALITQRRRWIVPSLLPFALSLYAYGTTALVLPLFFGAMLGLGLRQLRPHWRAWTLALGLFLLAAAPFLLFFLENYVVKRNFAWTDSLFFSTPLLPATRASQVAGGAMGDIVARNFQFLLESCNDGTDYNLLPGYKLLLSLTLPFALVGWLIGGWQLVRRRGQVCATPAGIVLTLFAVWGLAAFSLFVAVDLNVNRFNHFYLPCIVLATWAIATTIRHFQPSVPHRVLRVAVVAWVLLEGGAAVQEYFHGYRNGNIKNQFNEGLGEAFAEVNNLWGIDQVRITDRMPLPYVYTLFFLSYPPRQFQQEAQVQVVDGTYQVRRFGRYVFAPEELKDADSYGYLSRKDEYADTPEHHRQVVFTNDMWEVGIIKPGPRP